METINTLVSKYGYTRTELLEMPPYEFEMTVAVVIKANEEEKERIKQAMQTRG